MSCSSWCSREHENGEYESAPEFVAPTSDAALVTAQVLGFDGAGEGGGRQLLVSLGGRAVERARRPPAQQAT